MPTRRQFIRKHKIRRAFDRAADSYDDAAVLQKEVCRRLLEKLEYIRLSPELILDAGAGPGEAIKPLMERYRKSRVVALDLSERMLAKASAHRRLLHHHGDGGEQHGVVGEGCEELGRKNPVEVPFHTPASTRRWAAT